LPCAVATRFLVEANRIVKPADAEDVLAPLVQQGGIDDQVQFAARLQRRGQLDRHLLRQASDSPGRTAEEVVEAVEGMPSLAGDASSANRLEDAKLGPLPQASQPAKEDLRVREDGWLSEDARETLQNNIQRWYERPHTGTSLCQSRVSDAMP